MDEFSRISFSHDDDAILFTFIFTGTDWSLNAVAIAIFS